MCWNNKKSWLELNCGKFFEFNFGISLVWAEQQSASFMQLMSESPSRPSGPERSCRNTRPAGPNCEYLSINRCMNAKSGWHHNTVCFTAIRARTAFRVSWGILGLKGTPGKGWVCLRNPPCQISWTADRIWIWWISKCILFCSLQMALVVMQPHTHQKHTPSHD